jgi:hypothetical protein
MPLDTNLLYGEMAGSWLAHMAIPVAVSTLISMAFSTYTLRTRTLILVLLTTAISFLVQWGFLTFLQASSCNGVKDYKSITLGAVIATVITAGMTAIPAFIEPVRLAVSQLFGEHKPLLTAAAAKINKIVVETGVQVLAESTGKPAEGAAAAVADTPEDSEKQLASAILEYDNQTMKEIMYGVSYWSAFAGAYGVGIGSLIAAKCPANS